MTTPAGFENHIDQVGTLVQAQTVAVAQGTFGNTVFQGPVTISILPELAGALGSGQLKPGAASDVQRSTAVFDATAKMGLKAQLDASRKHVLARDSAYARIFITEGGSARTRRVFGFRLRTQSRLPKLRQILIDCDVLRGDVDRFWLDLGARFELGNTAAPDSVVRALLQSLASNHVLLAILNAQNVLTSKRLLATLREMMDLIGKGLPIATGNCMLVLLVDEGDDSTLKLNFDQEAATWLHPDAWAAAASAHNAAARFNLPVVLAPDDAWDGAGVDDWFDDMPLPDKDEALRAQIHAALKAGLGLPAVQNTVLNTYKLRSVEFENWLRQQT